jgi:flagellar assembly factor FliW
MEITTSRFGPIEIEAESVICFPAGLLGLEDCRQWVLLADHHNDAVAWLQSIQHPEVALPVVSPRRFVPGYQMRAAPRELAALQLDNVKKAKVLTILGRTDRAFTLNLKAPLVFNLKRGLGRQVVANGDLPVRFELGGAHPAFRRSA